MSPSTLLRPHRLLRGGSGGKQALGSPAHRALPTFTSWWWSWGRGLFPCSICSVKFVKCKESLNSCIFKREILFNPFVF